MKNCDRCKRECERASVERWKAEDGKEPVLIQTLCTACSRDDDMAKYRATGVLCNNMISAAIFYMQDVRYRTGGPDGGWVEWMRGPDRAEQRGGIIRRMRECRNLADDYRKIAGEYETVQAAVKSFERNVWFAWLKTYWNDATSRGHKSTIAGLDVLLWGCAGRAVMTLQDPVTKDSVTVITDDSSDAACMGIQGIATTAANASCLLYLACSNSSELRKNFKTDDNVRPSWPPSSAPTSARMF